MRICKDEQGTPGWIAARLGCPSASMFSKLCTSKGVWSTQADSYINQLVAEELTGEQTAFYQNDHMLRGTELEPEARDLYCVLQDVEVKEVGFCLHETIAAGCSPDGLVGESGGLEIKCPAGATHVGYLRDGILPLKYKQQVMGCLWVTERDWWDFFSYHPGMKPLIVRVERDEEYIAKLEECVSRAVNSINDNVIKFWD